MREKVLSLAKGNFVYETPELVLTPERLEFQVTAGDRKKENFVIENRRGSVLKGFGSSEDVAVDFLPVFQAEKNELTVEVDAAELVPGQRLKGKLHLVTDCGEAELPYDIQVTAPVLEDEKGQVKDYSDLCRRIEEDEEEAASLFHNPKFKEVFLCRDEMGKLLYQHLIKKNTRLQSMEEFLVAMGKKKPKKKENSSAEPDGDKQKEQVEKAENPERKSKYERKEKFASLFRCVLAFREERMEKEEFHKFLWENREWTEVVFGEYNQLFIQYIKFLATKQDEDREMVSRLMESFEETEDNAGFFFWLRLQVDERYRSLSWRTEDIREQLRQGGNSPLLYSELMLVYRQDVGLIVSLDQITLSALWYGLKHDLMTKEAALAVSLLAERMQQWNPLTFAVLKEIYEKYEMTDTLHSICGLLIRSEKSDKKYFSWFERGVEQRLRLTDLYEYYMYSMDYASTFSLPDSVISYFQYENHLNDSCKAFLYAYIVKKKNEQPENYRLYYDSIYEFALRQMAHHRVSEDICTIYHGLLEPEMIRGQVARDLPYVMFNHLLLCDDERIESVVVLHGEMKEELVYPLDNGRAVIQLFTPNYQIFFVNKEGHYLAGTVDYTLKKMLQVEQYAIHCWENGSEHVHLLAHLAVKAMSAARLDEKQAMILYQVMERKCFREHTMGKLFLRLYDYYYEKRETTLLLEVLDRISPDYIKRERIGEIATDCIYHGMYEKAYKMLVRYGIDGCDKKALGMMAAKQIQDSQGEFSPLLVKWCYVLYQEKCYDYHILDYLLQYYMGPVSSLTAIYKKQEELQSSSIADGSKERLLGQVLFVGNSPVRYEKLFLDYYERGANRMLVKAFLSYYAYEYLVGHLEDLTEDIFVKIEKEAFYVKEPIMVLATLKRYSRGNHFAKKQMEFIERNLEEYAGDGLILAFMKDFIGKVTVPYEIENTVLIQYNSGTVKAVFLHIIEPDGQQKVVPMKKVFDGIFVYEMLLFRDEEKTCYIEEEESGMKTEEMVLKRPENAELSPGFFQMVNQMIQAREQDEDEEYKKLRSRYEKMRGAAASLFSIE